MATNEEKTKVLAAQTPLASADGVDAIAVRKGNGIELLAPAKLTVGAATKATKAKGMDTSTIGSFNSYGTLKERIAAWAASANGLQLGSVATFALNVTDFVNAWNSNDNDYTIASTTKASLFRLDNYANGQYFNLLMSTLNTNYPLWIITYFNGSWSIKKAFV